MEWAGKQHPVETLAEWIAPAALAGGFGWSAASVGLAQPAVALLGGAAFAAGLLAMRMIGRQRQAAAPAFEPVPFEELDAGLGELLLDNPLVGDADELLLDDPLTDIADNARVVRLFARQEPTPGELVARIEDFLGDGQRRPVAATEPVRAAPDAGAALHAALANVRASLK